MSENITTKIDEGILTITIDLEHEGGRSKSGKTITVATTRGAAKLEGGVMLNLNAYKYPTTD